MPLGARIVRGLHKILCTCTKFTCWGLRFGGWLTYVAAVQPKRVSFSGDVIKRVLLIAVLAVLAALPSAAAAGTTGGTSGPTLRVAADTTFSTFNPFLAYFQGDLDVIDAIYPTLTSYGENGDPEPYLATKWTTSANHLTWTFTIRSGLKWSDGTPLTASDIAWTYNLIMTNQAAATANGSLVGDFASVTAPDATTLVIKTKALVSDLLYTGATIPVVPEHVWTAQVKNLSSFRNMSSFPVVGYGPWALTGYVPDQYATLTANKDFYGGAPAYQTLVVQYYSDSDAAVDALRSGQLDEIDVLSATQYDSLRGTKGISVYPTAPNVWDAIELNTGARTQSGTKFGNGNPALTDPVVRKAIALAINRSELVSKVMDGLGTAGAGYLPPAWPQWSWTPPASEFEGYDPAEANKLLNAAGFKMGPGGVRIDPKTHQPLTFRFGIHSDEITDSEIAPYLVEWMAAIGIKLDVQSMSFTQLNTVLPEGDWDILMDMWATSSDPSYLLSVQTCGTLPTSVGSTGNTDAFFCDPDYDKLYDQQFTEFSQAARAKTIDAMQNLLYQANTDIILYYSGPLEAVRTSSVSDFIFGKQNGAGFYPVQNDFFNWELAKPVAAAGAGGSDTGLLVGIPVAAVVVIGLGIFIVMRRRVTAGDRE
jgi:peptide/nickel transport system substrate-binding protein